MKCERCVRAEEAQYRARTDVIDMKVCAPSAAEDRGWDLRLNRSIQYTRPCRTQDIRGDA